MTTVIPLTTKRSTETTHQTTPHFALVFTFCILKLYIFPIESAFEYLHQPNRKKLRQKKPPLSILLLDFKLIGSAENHAVIFEQGMDERPSEARVKSRKLGGKSFC